MLLRRERAELSDSKDGVAAEEKRASGAGDRGRTGDIFLGKEALYH